jgi:hypothetical protein
MIQFLSDPWLKDHQAFAAALVAFAGTFLTVSALIIGYLLNARFNRMQADRIRHQDAVALAAVLISEIQAIGNQSQVLHQMITGLIQHKDENDTGVNASEKLKISYVPAFQLEKAAERFGLLGPKLTLEVSNFYFLYLDVFGVLKMVKKMEAHSPAVAAMLPGIRTGMELIDEKASNVVPSLVKFATSKGPLKIDPDWLESFSPRHRRLSVRGFRSPYDPKNTMGPISVPPHSKFGFSAVPDPSHPAEEH